MTVTANYQLANTSGYKLNIAKIGEYVYDPLAYYNKANFPDVEVTRPNTTTDLTKLHDKAILTVNGFVHATSHIEDKLYILEATKTLMKSRQNNVGILSFNGLQGNLTKTAITSDMIASDYPMPMYEKALIDFGRPIGHAMLVMGGYMLFEHPEFFYRVSESTFALRLDRLNYMEKLYELNKYRDIFKELGVETSPNNTSVIDAATVRSDITITKFLSLTNSFLVELPVTSFSLSKIYLEHSNLPGSFRTEVGPTLPFFGGYGKMIEYTKRKNNDVKYTVHTCDAYYNNYLFSDKPIDTVTLYNNQRVLGNSYNLSPGFFLQVNMTE